MSDPITNILTRLDTIERHVERLRKTDASGVWVAYTPTYLGGTTPGSTTYTTQQGWYFQTGKIIFVTGLVVWTAATGTGNAQVSLPFAPSASVAFRASGSCRLVSVTFANSSPQIILAASAANFTMDSPLTNAAPTTVQIEAAGNITFSLFYGVD